MNTHLPDIPDFVHVRHIEDEDGGKTKKTFKHMASYWREDIPIHESYQIPTSQNYIYILFLFFFSQRLILHIRLRERERERCVDWGGWARVYNDSHGQVTNITGLSFSLFLGLWHVDVRPYYFFFLFLSLFPHFIFIYSIHSVLIYILL